MNKDEMKMIDAMCKILNFNCKIECDKCQAKDFCSTYFECKALYNANCRIIADDEIVVKMTDIMDLNNKAQGTTDFLRDKLAEISKQIDEATKIADDEIVVKKSEYETLKAQNDTLELSVKDLRYRNAQFSEANKLFAKRNDELLDELQGATAIKEKTVREVLAKVDYESNGQTIQITNILRRKYGIELE